MKSRTYNRPPLQEVIVEILVGPSTAWDLTVPGILYEGLKKDFPVRERRQIQEVDIQQATGSSALNVKQSERAVFLANDRRRLVQVGDRLIAVNQLPPYPGWQEVRNSVQAAYTALKAVVTVNELRQLSLRYIDRIVIPGTKVKVEDYLKFRPHFEGVEKDSPLDTWAAFIVGIQVPYDDSKNLLRIQIGSGLPEKDKQVFSMETDYRLVQAGAVHTEQILEWLDVAHRRCDAAFESAITDNLRQLFQPVEE
ncbi:MAG: TIGR04255 family protein [Chloroflexi bacterium]|nr:TIGR04255 family protein [Chloroflexota bacterium]